MTKCNNRTARLAIALASAWMAFATQAAPTVTRLTPPSELFSSGRAAPVIARFLPGQRFDLQATIRPDDATKQISSVVFAVDGKTIAESVALKTCEAACLKGVPANATLASIRAFSLDKPGLHNLRVTATQSDGQTVTAEGNFEVVELLPGAQKVKNIIILLGDGMGAAQRTAARIVAGGYAQGKSIKPLAMDPFP